MGRADRGPAEILAARLLRAYRAGAPQPVDPCLGLQGRRRALQPARQGPRSRRLAAGDPRPVRPAGEHVRRAGGILAAALVPNLPSPPFRGEREGPIAERWEGEVGIAERSGIPHLTPALSAPWGGEGVDHLRCPRCEM